MRGSDLHAYLGKLIITPAWQEMFKQTVYGTTPTDSTNLKFYFKRTEINALHIQSLLCFSFSLEEGTDNITCRKKPAKLA